MIRIDISMPKTCSDCPCLRTYDILNWGEVTGFSHAWCAVLNEELAEKVDDRGGFVEEGFDIFGGRLSKCPLLEGEE